MGRDCCENRRQWGERVDLAPKVEHLPVLPLALLPHNNLRTAQIAIAAQGIGAPQEYSALSGHRNIKFPATSDCVDIWLSLPQLQRLCILHSASVRLEHASTRISYTADH